MSFPRGIAELIGRLASRGLLRLEKLIPERWRIFERSGGGARVFVAVAEVKPEPDSNLPEPIRTLIRETKERPLSMRTLAPLIRLAGKGVVVEALLVNGTASGNPMVVILNQAAQRGRIPLRSQAD